MRKVRFLIFLKDVLYLSLTSFGGPQAHLALFIKILVNKRRYIKEEELVELCSLCNILPGPASTQTLTAVGFKIGGPTLAFLTLLVWILPATLVMIGAALSVEYLKGSLEVARFIQPMAVSFVAFAAYKIIRVAINTKTAFVIFLISATACYLIQSPGVFPIVLILSGLATSLRFKKHPKIEKKEEWKIEWGNFILYASIFIAAALLGEILHYKPIRLFENFFRNGSLIFGGGQPLSGLLHKEFVEFKKYVTHQEFISGYAVLQALPGPLFAFSSFIGSLSLREFGLAGQVAGGFIAAAGIFLPGTLMIFFVIRFWERLKKHRPVKASLEGINAASAGIVFATAVLLFQPVVLNYENIEDLYLNLTILIVTLILLIFTKIPPPFYVLTGLVLGLIF